MRMREDAEEVVARRCAAGSSTRRFPIPSSARSITEAMLPGEIGIPARLRDRLRGAAARRWRMRYQRASVGARHAAARRPHPVALVDGRGARSFGPTHIGVRQGRGRRRTASSGPARPPDRALLGSRPEVVSEDQDRFFLPALESREARPTASHRRPSDEGRHTPWTEFLSRFQSLRPGSLLDRASRWVWCSSDSVCDCVASGWCARRTPRRPRADGTTSCASTRSSSACHVRLCFRRFLPKRLGLPKAGRAIGIPCGSRTALRARHSDA